MKNFFSRYKKLHIWLLVLLFLLALFLIFRTDQDLMNWLVTEVTQPMKDAVASVCYLVSFPVIEILYILAGAWVVLHIVVSAVKIHRSKGHRRSAAYRSFLILLCVVLTVADWFCLVWGINYYADGFQEKSGLYAQEVEVSELYRVTAYFTEQVNAASQAIPRDENGLFAVSREEIFADSTSIYENLCDEFPFLERQDRVPKPMIFSKLLSAMGFTGFYAGFTGESVLNVDSPAAYLPCTIAHELAHQRGIASEQECNFIAILASTQSGNPVYAYSGYLTGYVHLSNALYRADREAWQELRSQLDEGVLADIQNNSIYWDQWESPIDTVSNAIYDTMLKSYGQSDGIQSYGTVVDLLVAYY